jgi:hypothetical protein
VGTVKQHDICGRDKGERMKITFETEQKKRWEFLNRSKKWRELYAKFRYVAACNGAVTIALLDMGLALYGEEEFNKILEKGGGYPKLYARMYRDFIAIINKVGKLQRHLEYKTKYQRPVIRDSACLSASEKAKEKV